MIAYCIWMLVSEEKRYPLVRGIGAGLFLLTVAAFAQVLHPDSGGRKPRLFQTLWCALLAPGALQTEG